MVTEYTAPEVFTRGVEEGWADPEADPTKIDWPPRQRAAAIWFEVEDGRPVNPCEQPAIQRPAINWATGAKPWLPMPWSLSPSRHLVSAGRCL